MANMTISAAGSSVAAASRYQMAAQTRKVTNNAPKKQSSADAGEKIVMKNAESRKATAKQQENAIREQTVKYSKEAKKQQASDTKETLERQKEQTAGIRLQAAKSENIILKQARHKAESVSNNMYARIAREEFSDDRMDSASLEISRVEQTEPNKFIESLTSDLQDDLLNASIGRGNYIGEMTSYEVPEYMMEGAKASFEPVEFEPVTNPVIENLESEPAANPVLENMKADAADDTEPENAGFEPQITSYEGYTDQQLRGLYLEGTMSRFSYESEISSRTDENEVGNEKEQVFREGIVRNISDANKEETASKVSEHDNADKKAATLTDEQKAAIFKAAGGTAEMDAAGKGFKEVLEA